jgi:hypothetical protein
MASGVTILLKPIYSGIFHSHNLLAEPSELFETDPVIILILGSELGVLFMERFLTHIMGIKQFQYVFVVLA